MVQTAPRRTRGERSPRFLLVRGRGSRGGEVPPTPVGKPGVARRTRGVVLWMIAVERSRLPHSISLNAGAGK